MQASAGSASFPEIFDQPGSRGPPLAKPAATRLSASRQRSPTQLGATISTTSGFSDPAANAHLDQPGSTAGPISGSVPSAKTAQEPVPAGAQKRVTQLSNKASSSSIATVGNNADSMENWQRMLADDSDLAFIRPQPRKPRSSIGGPDASTQPTAAAVKESGSLDVAPPSEANLHVGLFSAATKRNAASAIARSKKFTSSSGVPTSVANKQAEQQAETSAASASSNEKPASHTDAATVRGSKTSTQHLLASHPKLSAPAVGGLMAVRLAHTPASMPVSTLPDSTAGLTPAHDKSGSSSGSAPTALDGALPSVGSNNTAKSRSAQRYANLMANLGVAKPPSANESAEQKAPSTLKEGSTASRRASLFAPTSAPKSTAAVLPSHSKASADRTLAMPKAAAAGPKLESTAEALSGLAATSAAESSVKPPSTVSISGSTAMTVPPAEAQSAVTSNRSLPKQIQLETLPSNSSSSQAPARKTAAPPAQAQAMPASSSQQTSNQQPSAAPSSRLSPFDKLAAAPTPQLAATAKPVSASRIHAKPPSITTHTTHTLCS